MIDKSDDRQVSGMSDVTRLLNRMEQGGADAAGELFSVVYSELRQMASVRMRHEQPGQTIGPTALVHEAWLRLVGDDREWTSSGHFFSAAAEAMRRILIDRARSRRAWKRGGRLQRVELDDDALSLETDDDRLLVLDEALDAFAAVDPDKAQFVKLRYFAGCSIDQAAELLGLSVPTANRHWAYSRAWLQSWMNREMEGT